LGLGRRLVALVGLEQLVALVGLERLVALVGLERLVAVELGRLARSWLGLAKLRLGRLGVWLWLGRLGVGSGARADLVEHRQHRQRRCLGWCLPIFPVLWLRLRLAHLRLRLPCLWGADLVSRCGTIVGERRETKVQLSNP
jgi:hypothetical protein